MKLLENKVTLVTGAGRGIGSSIARLFAEHGAKVIVHYNSTSAPAISLAAEIGGMAVQADLREPEQVNRLVQEVLAAYGSIDVLVNNASSFKHASSFDGETWADYMEEWTGVFGTTFHAIKGVLPIMKVQRSGRIINFAATLVQRPTSGYGAHTCAKAAVLSLSKTLSKELGAYNITVNTVSPGMTLTDFSKSLPENQRDKVSDATPLQRLAEPEDVARICLFYASELSSFVTGANIAPDGGLATT